MLFFVKKQDYLPFIKHKIIDVITEIGINMYNVIKSKIETKDGIISKKYLKQNRWSIGNTYKIANIFFEFVWNVSLLFKVMSTTRLKIIEIVDITSKNLNKLTKNTKICTKSSGFVYCNKFSNLVNERIRYKATTIRRFIV